MNGTGILNDGRYNEETRRRRQGWTHKGLSAGRAGTNGTAGQRETRGCVTHGPSMTKHSVHLR